MTPAQFGVPDACRLRDDPVSVSHRTINYELCRNCIDLTQLGMVLDKMEQAGMNPKFVELYKTSADALLQLLRSENNRIHGC